MSKLLNAIRNNDLSTIQQLVSKHTDINFRNRIRFRLPDGLGGYPAAYDELPLHVAIETAEFSIIQYLVEKGADVNAKDQAYNLTPEYSPITLAIHCKRLDVAQYLIRNGAVCSPLLERAIEDNNLSMAEFFATNPKINFIIQQGRLDVIEFMHAHHQIKIDEPLDWEKRTALHIAVREGQLEIVKCLLSMGFSPCARDINSFTPLQEAAKLNHKDILACLLKHDTDVLLLNSSKELHKNKAISSSWTANKNSIPSIFSTHSYTNKFFRPISVGTKQINSENSEQKRNFHSSPITPSRISIFSHSNISKASLLPTVLKFGSKFI